MKLQDLRQYLEKKTGKTSQWQMRRRRHREEKWDWQLPGVDPVD
jgi:hypothetical protein